MRALIGLLHTKTRAKELVDWAFDHGMYPLFLPKDRIPEQYPLNWDPLKYEPWGEEGDLMLAGWIDFNENMKYFFAKEPLVYWDGQQYDSNPKGVRCEQDLADAYCKVLLQENYKILFNDVSKRNNVDIIAVKSGNSAPTLIECKLEPSSTNIKTAVGQLLYHALDHQWCASLRLVTARPVRPTHKQRLFHLGIECICLNLQF